MTLAQIEGLVILAAVFVAGWFFSRFVFEWLWWAGRAVGESLRALVRRAAGD
jgi:hypothetical protein